MQKNNFLHEEDLEILKQVQSGDITMEIAIGLLNKQIETRVYNLVGKGVFPWENKIEILRAVDKMRSYEKTAHKYPKKRAPARNFKIIRDRSREPDDVLPLSDVYNFDGKHCSICGVVLMKYQYRLMTCLSCRSLYRNRVTYDPYKNRIFLQREEKHD